VQSPRLDEEAILERYRARTPNSAKLFREAMKVTPGGVMAGIKFFDPYPLFMQKAAGSRIWDVDGNEYLDYLMGYGAVVLGHGHDVVKSSVNSTLQRMGTTITGTPTPKEIEYGSILRDLYHVDGMVRFTNSGLEATLLAVRLAKGHTGRKKVAKFEGHYHGAVDDLLVSYTPGIGQSGPAWAPLPVKDSVDVDEGILSESVILPFNDWEGTERRITQSAGDLSCVILEPFEEGVIAGEPAFMKNLRKLTKDLGIPLIYDEVKTGFRVRLGGASEFYSIVPDISCLGKIIGGGFPVGAVVGDSEVMGRLDPTLDSDSRVFHSGTFNGNPMSLSVGMATVEELRRDGNFATLCQRTERLKSTLGSELRARGLDHQVEGEGGMFNLYFTRGKVRNYRDAVRSDMRLRRLLDLQLIVEGVYLKPLNRYCLSLSHSEDDIAITRKRFARALDHVTAKSN
jgi:glutamate-1-semialdehyde 2,1-aminomutase